MAIHPLNRPVNLLLVCGKNTQYDLKWAGPVKHNKKNKNKIHKLMLQRERN